jgi:hypothetical protein
MFGIVNTCTCGAPGGVYGHERHCGEVEPESKDYRGMEALPKVGKVALCNNFADMPKSYEVEDLEF